FLQGDGKADEILGEQIDARVIHARKTSEWPRLAKRGRHPVPSGKLWTCSAYVPGRFSASSPLGLVSEAVAPLPLAPDVALCSDRSKSLSKGLPVKTSSPAVSKTKTRGMPLKEMGLLTPLVIV